MENGDRLLSPPLMGQMLMSYCLKFEPLKVTTTRTWLLNDQNFINSLKVGYEEYNHASSLTIVLNEAEGIDWPLSNDRCT